MDKKSGSGSNSGAEMEIWPLESCRFAYTINNYQPVRCTWISDQPLFYADYDDAIEDDDYTDDPILQALERDIADMREKAIAYDKISTGFIEEENAVSREFQADAAFVGTFCAEAHDTLHSVMTLLGESRLAAQLLGFAKLNDVRILESRQTLDASYDRDSKTILVRPDLDISTKALLVTCELRRMWQHKNGAGLHPLSLHPDYAVLINRAQNADLLVNMVRVAWELQLAGHKECWMRIENSTMADLGRAFAREAIADFRSINNGLAARATFETWFLSERCRKADRTLIQQMLADYQGYVFCDNPEASRLIAHDLVRALGKVPFGGNYIEPIANNIMIDPVFTDVRDRSNANFLWFIKFERSFTSAEQEVVDAGNKKTKTPAAILSFPKIQQQEKLSKKTAEKSTGTPAEIISLTST